MTRAAVSLFAFAIYLLVLGPFLIVSPNFLLALFGLPPTDEVFIRIAGVTVLVIGYFDINVARAGFTPFFRWSVNARCAVFLFFVAFVVMGLARPQLVLFGTVDLAGATWTFFALRADAAAAPA